MRLRGGAGIETRTSPKDKLLIPGDTLPQKVSNNWQMWGDKGLLATHIAFEIGVAVMIMPLRMNRAIPSEEELAQITPGGIPELFVTRAQQVNDMHMYEEFYKSGWTPKLIKMVRKELAPVIVNTITLVWYSAVRDAAK